MEILKECLFGVCVWYATMGRHYFTTLQYSLHLVTHWMLFDRKKESTSWRFMQISRLNMLWPCVMHFLMIVSWPGLATRLPKGAQSPPWTQKGLHSYRVSLQICQLSCVYIHITSETFHTVCMYIKLMKAVVLSLFRMRWKEVWKGGDGQHEQSNQSKD